MDQQSYLIVAGLVCTLPGIHRMKVREKDRDAVSDNGNVYSAGDWGNV